ncbi:MAG: GNVR domain-containing protein [Candidatus Omnitrophota bacterium]|nr:GNVR domain-containing protein [Candidatus Omnitrophota bacterium]
MDLQSVIQKQPADYLKIVFRRKWFLIIPIVIGIVAGIIFCNTLPKKYESSTLILVEEGRVANPLMQGLTVSTSTAQRLNVLREQIWGWDRMLQLIKTLNLAKDVRNQAQFEDLVKRLRGTLRVDLRGPSIVRIGYISKSPQEAQNIVKTITDIFIVENLRQQTKETEDAVNFINDQLSMFQKKLKESEIADMEDKLKKLLIDSTDRHPLVIELKKKIASAKDEVKRGDFTVDASSIANSDNELNTMKDELKQMREDVASSKTLNVIDGDANRAKMASSSNEKLYKLLLLEKVNQATAKDQTVNQKIYNTLLERLETAKITQRLEASKEGTRYTILDPARLPINPKSPNKPLTLLMGIFIGAAAGMGLVFLVELFDHSFLGLDEARAFITLPIFGATSKIITQEDLKVDKLRRARITGISVVTGVALLIVIIFTVFLGN